MKITSSGDVTIVIAADDQTKASIEAAKQRIGQLGSHTETTLSKMASKWAAVAAAVYSFSKAFQWMESAADYNEQLNRMDAFARAYNTTATAMLNELQRVTDGMIANADLVAVSTESMLRGLKPDQIKEFAKHADNLGDTLGIKGVDAFRAMTEAAVSGRGMWKIGAMEAKDLDAALGSQVNTMSDSEKMQARITLMLKLMSQQFAESGSSVKSVSDQFEQWNATLKNWKEIAGTLLVKAGAVLAAVFAAIGGAANWMFGIILTGFGKLIELVDKVPGGNVISRMFGGKEGARYIQEIGGGFLEGSKISAQFVIQSLRVAKSFGEIDNTATAVIPKLQGNTKAMQELASAQAQWNSKVEALNPFIDAEDKQVIALTQSMNELIQKYGNAKWIYEGYAKAITYMDYSEAMKQNEEKQKLDEKYLQEKEEKFRSYLQKIQKYNNILNQEEYRNKNRDKGEPVLDYTPKQEAELAVAEETKQMLNRLNMQADQYSKEKYEELQNKITDLYDRQVEHRMTYFKLTYTKAFEEMIGMSNQLGGELGKAFGMAAANLKEITDAKKNLDPYGEEIVKLQETIYIKEDLMREQGYTELEIENATWQMKVQQDQLYQQQRLQMAASTFGMMAGLANAYYQMSDQKSKTAFTAYKAFAIAQALISTYLAATKALASVPYPFSIVAMIMTIAMGLMQVKQIAAQKMGGSESASYGGTGEAGGYSQSNPSTSSWESSEASKQTSTKSVEIHIHGNVVDHAAFVRELAPYISEAKGDKVSYGEQ